MQKKKTLVVGASLKPERYSHMAVLRLQQHHYPVIAYGFEEGKIGATPITTAFPNDTDIHSVTLYLNPKRQEAYYDAILQLKPKRIIFNPGTENEVFKKLAEQHGIATQEACTLVMLSVGNY